MCINVLWIWFILCKQFFSSFYLQDSCYSNIYSDFSDMVLGIWWRYPEGLICLKSFITKEFLNCSRVAPSAGPFVLCVLTVWYGVTAVTLFKGQTQHLPTTPCVDSIDKISREQFLAGSVSSSMLCLQVPLLLLLLLLLCWGVGSSSVPCVLQHRRWYWAAWMMFAVQAAVPCSRVPDTPWGTR